MFQPRNTSSPFRSAAAILDVTYHATVRSIQSTDNNAVVALLSTLLQTCLLVGFFFVMFEILGARSIAVRGDFVLYLLSGVFLYLGHVKAVGAVLGASGSTEGMMLHAPMNTAISVMSAALGTLYIQILAVCIILVVYHSAVAPITIENWAGAAFCLIMSWLFGVAVGLVFFAIKPWAPKFIMMVSMIYRRVNMIASGKMFLANTLPSSMLVMFDWNPLFHLIDQSRGFTFINYNPHVTSLSYPIYVTLVLIVLGMMGEFYTKRHSSMSWGAWR